MQRFHPCIRPGLNLSTCGSKIPIHSQQSRWDSACALHCLAMVLQIDGLIDDTSRIATQPRRLEAKLWRNSVPYFFKGTTFGELVALIADLDCGLRTKLLDSGPHREVVAFAVRELARKRLVICSWRAVGESQSHAVLVIGVEGTQFGGRFDGQTLLLLDPAEGPPAAMATCNARLHYVARKPSEVSRYATYTTASETFSVVLNGAVSVETSHRQKPPYLP